MYAIVAFGHCREVGTYAEACASYERERRRMLSFAPTVQVALRSHGPHGRMIRVVNRRWPPLGKRLGQPVLPE
jgi:hypothetical protein